MSVEVAPKKPEGTPKEIVVLYFTGYQCGYCDKKYSEKVADLSHHEKELPDGSIVSCPGVGTPTVETYMPMPTSERLYTLLNQIGLIREPQKDELFPKCVSISEINAMLDKLAPLAE